METAAKCHKDKRDYPQIKSWGNMTQEILEDEFPWFLKAEVKDAEIDYDDGVLVWEEGFWLDGTWENGVWKDGCWYGGTWKKGIWEDGYWEDGLWESGAWLGGTWKEGEWKDGYWSNGKIWDKVAKKLIPSEMAPR